MGYRLHVAREYKVEYALGDAFNHKCEEFHDLLSALGAEYTGESWDADFEVSKDDWKKAIDKLKNLNNLEDPDEKAEITECICKLEYSTNEVVERLEYYLKNGDTFDGYLHFSYF